MPSDLVVKGVHGRGNTRLVFSLDGKKIYTGGEDCLVRAWDASLGASQEPKVVCEAEKAITALVCSRDGWVSGSTEALVRYYSTNTDGLLGMVAQTNAIPVRCLAFSPKGDRLAVGSDELSLRVVSMNGTLQCSILEDHTKALRALTWHPSGAQLTTSGQDGKILVWDYLQSEYKVVKELDDIIPAVSDQLDDAFFYESAAVWHPRGGYFVAATTTHDIVIVDRSTWAKAGSFSIGGYSSAITAIAFSANGCYLASAGKDGQIIIWDSDARRALFRHKTEGGSVISIAFSPSTNLLAWANLDGDVGRWNDPIPIGHPPPFGVSSTTDVSRVTAKEKGKANAKRLDALFGEDEEMGESTEPLPIAEIEDDWIKDDLRGEYKLSKGAHHDGLREMVNVTKAQPPFQPGSTPFQGKKRYLAFNHIGVIEISDQGTHNIVSIEFHDKSLRRDYHFQDVYRFSMASIGERGIAFAAPAEDKNLAIVSYKPFDSWTSNGDWQVLLASGENPACIAAGGAPYQEYLDKGDVSGNGNIVVATTKGYLRFLSGGGGQRYLWNIGGNVIAMAAGPDWVFIVHREGNISFDGFQNLRYSLITFDTFDLIQQGMLPLPKGTVLEWMGITQEGAPAIYDSAGLISILDRFRRPTQGRWIPALDTTTVTRRAGKDEFYWMVGLSGKKFQCIILKGVDKFPGFPRPMIQELEVHMPLLNMDNPQSQLEESFLRESVQTIMLNDAHGHSPSVKTEIFKREIAQDKELIQLIQAACQSEKLLRALDAASLLLHPTSYQTAQKVAGFYHLTSLQEKIGILKELRERKINGDDHKDDQTNSRKNWVHVSEPVYRTRSEGVQNNNHEGGGHKEFSVTPIVTRRTHIPVIPIEELPFARPPPSTSNPLGIPKSIPPAPPNTSLLRDDTSMDLDSSFKLSELVREKRRLDEDYDTSIIENSVSVNDAGGAPSLTLPSMPASNKKPTNLFARSNGSNKGLVKRTSFFDKVDAAGVGSLNEGEVIAVKARQIALFKLPAPVNRPDKEAKGGKELWSIFHEQLDLDGNGQSDIVDPRVAIIKAGISMAASTQAQKILRDDCHGVARVNMEGDVSFSAEDLHHRHKAHRHRVHRLPTLDRGQSNKHIEDDGKGYYHDHDEDGKLEGEDARTSVMVAYSLAFRFLLAGGIAGAVSRTATAPFDLLKVYLMIHQREPPPTAEGITAFNVSKQTTHGVKSLAHTISHIYTKRGLRAFWVGNGLNVVKIFPESVIRFLSYEYAKRIFAKHWDKVDDPRQISGTSRFLSGGLGGIASQFSVHPLETLKTQMISSSGERRDSLISCVKRTWALGGIRAYYRGLTIGLIGVFPYSAIDMSTFEALKLAYSRSTGSQEPGVLALLAFGSVSGTVGATSVYPLNLVRTRLQASGSPGHPQRYSGMSEVVKATMEKEGWRGFYRGLVPTLAKVIPAVSISYVVYETSQRKGRQKFWLTHGVPKSFFDAKTPPPPEYVLY